MNREPATADNGTRAFARSGEKGGSAVSRGASTDPTAPLDGGNIAVVVMARIRFYREGLSRLFAELGGFSVVGSLQTPSGASAAIRELDPDVVLLALDGEVDVGLVREIVREAPRSRLVTLGITDDDTRIVALAEAGVCGYVGVDAGSKELVSIVTSVARGEALCSPRVTAILLRRVATLARSQAEEAPAPRSTVTSREREIFTLIARGLSNKEIARDLCIELSTVKNHVHNVLEKLQVPGRAEAVALLRRRAELGPSPVHDTTAFPPETLRI